MSEKTAPSGDLMPLVEELATVESPAIPSGANAMTLRVTLPPGSPGAPPHRHPGPAFGYVTEGEIIFEVEGKPQQVFRAGDTFWEPGGDVIHYQDANNLTDAQSQIVVTILAAPGEPILTFVSDEELEERRDRRAPRP